MLVRWRTVGRHRRWRCHGNRRRAGGRGAPWKFPSGGASCSATAVGGRSTAVGPGGGERTLDARARPMSLYIRSRTAAEGCLFILIRASRAFLSAGRRKHTRNCFGFSAYIATNRGLTILDEVQFFRFSVCQTARKVREVLNRSQHAPSVIIVIIRHVYVIVAAPQSRVARIRLLSISRGDIVAAY